MDGVPVEIVKRQIVHCYKADPAYGTGVAEAMGIDFRPADDRRGVDGSLRCRRRSSVPSAIPETNDCSGANLSAPSGQSHLWSQPCLNRIAPKLLAEFIGTFAFVFIGAGAAAVVGEGAGLPGIAAIALRPRLDHHGLRLRLWLRVGRALEPRRHCRRARRGRDGVGEALGYIVSQLIGGVAGALLLRTVLGGAATGLGMPALAHDLAFGRHVAHDHAGGRLHDRGRARFFPGDGRAQHSGRGSRRQSRTAGDRNDA